MYIIEKKLLKFSAAHRLVKNYKGKCQNLHGHNYHIAVSFVQNKLNEHDLMVDFGVISDLFNKYVQENIDHSVIVSDADQSLLDFVRQGQQKHYIIDQGRNTSVEVLTNELFYQFTAIIEANKDRFHGAELQHVKIHETDTAWAIYCENYSQVSANCCGSDTSIRE